MATFRRIANGYETLTMAQARHITVWRECPHCKARTPWAVRAVSGYYRCLRCGNNPLGALQRKGGGQ